VRVCYYSSAPVEKEVALVAHTAGRSKPGEVVLPPAEPLYRMEEAVKRTGLTPRAIRYYEELGLLRPSGRTSGGFRLFTEADLAQLRRINELQTLLGFSLAEIKQLLDVEAMRAEVKDAYARTTDAAAREALLDRAIGLVESQVRIIDERMRRLGRLREEYEERLAKLRALRAAPDLPCGTAPPPGPASERSRA
jgi:DNA-binding transcriptional MerR regulator